MVCHRIFYLGVIAGLLTGFSGPLHAGEVLNLHEALDYAKKQNPELRAYRENARAAKARVPQAWSLEDPEVGIDFFETPASSGNPFDTTETRYFVEQKIPIGKLPAKGKMAGKESLMAEEELRAKELEILTEVKHAFHDLYFLERRLEINQESRQLLRGYEKVALTKYSTAEGDFQDTLKSSLEISKLEQEALNLEKEKTAMRAKLGRLLGRKNGFDFEIDLNAHPPKIDLTLEQVKAMAKKNQPALRASRYAAEAGRAGLSLARQNWLPDLNVGVEYMQRQNAQDAISYRVGMSVPLFGIWKQRKGVTEAKARWNAARAMEENTSNVLEEELETAWADWVRSQKTVTLYETAALPQARAAVESAKTGYESGKSGFLDLIDLQRTLKMTEENYWQAFVDTEKAIAHLEFLAGKEEL